MTHPEPHRNETEDKQQGAGQDTPPISLWMQFRRAPVSSKLSWGTIFFLITSVVVGLGYESTQERDCLELRDIRAVAHWFDPIFFQYTIGLGLIAILLVPIVPLTYATSMSQRKIDRLRGELVRGGPPDAEWIRICPQLRERSSPRFYLWATALTTIVVTLGIAILLLLKPVRDSGCGVNFGRGANMLLLGTYMELPHPNGGYSDAFFGHLLSSLVGFQFGFLGAYIYFLTSLSRAYFTLDLTPETFVEGSLRIAIASVLSLILSFLLGSASSVEGNPAIAGWLPAISFFFGFFPKRALAFLESVAGCCLRKFMNYLGETNDNQETPNKVIPLSNLHGMSYSHELRLEREGFDSVENLSHANAADLAVRTGFSYGQLRQWLSEAWLAAHLREDYTRFVSLTGITSREELARLMTLTPDHQKALSFLIGTESDQQTSKLRHKIAIILELSSAAPSHAAPPPPEPHLE